MTANIDCGKKGQITVFIIMGIIIIVAVAVLLYMRQTEQIPELEEVVEEVPVQTKPIQEFVTTCLYATAKDAFVLMGQHGGYIDMEDTEYTDKQLTMDPLDPTESDAAFFDIKGNNPVAYWWKLKSKNNCFSCVLSDEGRPSFQTMEKQASTYIEQNLATCIDRFSGFERQGFDIKERGKPDVETVIADKDIVVRLTYPLDVNILNRTTNMTKFFARLSLDMKGIYNFANNITRAEVRDAYLERIMKHIIIINSGPSFSRLPPTFAIEDSFVPITWSKTLVRLQLQSAFTSHIPLLQVNRTRGAQEINFSADSAIQNIYRPFFIDALNESFPKYSVRFLYLNWPVYFEITPNQGEMIKPSRIENVKTGMGGFSIPFVFKPMNYYEYYYDVSVPVIVEIKSYDEFFNETYTFFIAMEANIRDNKDMKEWFEGKGTLGPWDYSAFGLRATADVAEALESQEGVKKEDVENMSIVSGDITKTLFCNSKQRISGEVEVIVKDKLNGSGIDGAEVFYSCGSYETCKMGLAKLNSTTGISSLVSRFPICIGGGILRIEKPGYMKERVVEINTSAGLNQTIEVDLEKIFSKNFSVKKYVIDRIIINDSLAEEIKLLLWNNSLQTLGPYDMVIISFTKINETPWEDKFSKFLLFYGNDTKNDEYFGSIELVPGKYTLEIQYFYINKTVIPANCSHTCDQCDTDSCEKACRLYPEEYEDQCSEYSAFGVLFVGASCVPCGKCDVDVWQPEEAINLDNQILGGFKMNSSLPWTVSAEDLKDKNRKVEFHLVHAPLPRCIQDLSEMENVTPFYDTMQRRLAPRFV